MSRLQRHLPGPVSHVRGTAAGIPQHMRGKGRILLDTALTGSDVDCSAVGAHSIPGTTINTIDSGANELIATADGLVIDAAQDYARVWIPIASYPAGALLCVSVQIEPMVISHQYGLIEVQLAQATGSTDTQRDQRCSLRASTASNVRMFVGARGSSSFSMSYKGDNPAFGTGSLPSRLQLEMISWGRASQSTIGVGTDPTRYATPPAASANMAALVQSGSGTTAQVKGSLPVFTALRIGAKGYNASGQCKIRVRHITIEAFGV